MQDQNEAIVAFAHFEGWANESRSLPRMPPGIRGHLLFPDGCPSLAGLASYRDSSRRKILFGFVLEFLRQSDCVSYWVNQVTLHGCVVVVREIPIRAETLNNWFLKRSRSGKSAGSSPTFL